MKNFGIKIGNRYIKSCDENWYETCNYENFPYNSKEECIEVAMQLGLHYVYDMTFVTDDGQEEKFDYFQHKYHPKIKEGGNVLTNIIAMSFAM